MSSELVEDPYRPPAGESSATAPTPTPLVVVLVGAVLALHLIADPGYALMMQPASGDAAIFFGGIVCFAIDGWLLLALIRRWRLARWLLPLWIIGRELPALLPFDHHLSWGSPIPHSLILMTGTYGWAGAVGAVHIGLGAWFAAQPAVTAWFARR